MGFHGCVLPDQGNTGLFVSPELFNVRSEADSTFMDVSCQIEETLVCLSVQNCLMSGLKRTRLSWMCLARSVQNCLMSGLRQTRLSWMCLGRRTGEDETQK